MARGDRPAFTTAKSSPGLIESDWYKRWSDDPRKMYPSSDGKLMVVVSHDWGDLSQVVGYATPDDVTIDSRGLLVAAKLFDTPTAKTAWDLANTTGTGASFAFDIAHGGEHRRADGVNVITEFSEIIEVGPTLVGAESLAGTVGVKDVDRLLIEFKSLDASLRVRGLIGPTLTEFDAEMAAIEREAVRKGFITAEDAAVPSHSTTTSDGVLPLGPGGTVPEADVHGRNRRSESDTGWACPNCGQPLPKPQQLHPSIRWRAAVCPCGTLAFVESDVKHLTDEQLDQFVRTVTIHSENAIRHAMLKNASWSGRRLAIGHQIDDLQAIADGRA